MLLQNYRSANRAFEAVDFVVLEHLPKGPHGAAVSLPVVRHLTEKSLDLCGRVESLHKIPFVFSKLVFLRFRQLPLLGDSAAGQKFWGRTCLNYLVDVRLTTPNK